jgi:hypothetical protein
VCKRRRRCESVDCVGDWRHGGDRRQNDGDLSNFFVLPYQNQSALHRGAFQRCAFQGITLVRGAWFSRFACRALAWSPQAAGRRIARGRRLGAPPLGTAARSSGGGSAAPSPSGRGGRRFAWLRMLFIGRVDGAPMPPAKRPGMTAAPLALLDDASADLEAFPVVVDAGPSRELVAAASASEKVKIS